MKRYAALLILLIFVLTFGQGKLMHDGSGAPTGFCNNAIYVDTATGIHYSCTNNAWAADSSRMMMAGATPMVYRAKAVSLNSGVNTDVAAITGLPARYIVRRVTFENASGTPTLATVGVFTAAGGTGATVVTAQALSSLSATTVYLDGTLAITSTVLTSSSLTIRNIAVAGSAMTVDCTIEVTPLL